MKTKQWIYWRWKNDNFEMVHKSWLQEIVKLKANTILEFADSESWTNYPQRILLNEIKILQ